MEKQILVENGYIDLSFVQKTENLVDMSLTSTILNNLAYFGYTLSKSSLETLSFASPSDLKSFWKRYEPVFKKITGADRKMENFVVYKNFPQEVLAQTEAEYWDKQIKIYFGAEVSSLAQTVEDRASMVEIHKLKVLHLAPSNVSALIYQSLIKSTSSWNEKQAENVTFLCQELINKKEIETLSLSDFAFKANGISLINSMMKNDIGFSIEDATDILRLAAAMSNADISLRTSVRFKKFSRKDRKFLLNMLENSKNLLDDLTLRPEMWKRFLSNLHPGDYNFTAVNIAYNSLYNKAYSTFNSIVFSKIQNKDKSVLKMLSARAGEFLRQFHKLYEVYGEEAVLAFNSIANKLNTQQLLKFEKYINTINNRNSLMFAPQGKWSKVQISDNQKVKIELNHLTSMNNMISSIVKNRIKAIFPEGINLDFSVDQVKLQTNEQELASYGRGTVFSIPDNMKFIRSASFWSIKDRGTVWYDNSWNFFNEQWQPTGACCWAHTHCKGAIFSGDPVNSKELQGRACQMIDLDIENLINSGVRYAVWNILAYSGIPFEDANDVLATLQLGEDAQTGNLYEPKRAQMVFPLKGKNLTKYVAYIDLVDRKLVYLDANFSGSTQDAYYNGDNLSTKMPSFIEYLNTQPSVADLFLHAEKGSIPVSYSDKDLSLQENEKAFIFKAENQNNSYTQIDLNTILNSK